MSRSGWLRAASSTAASPGGGGVDLVASDPEVGGERPHDLRLVVDDQDPGHGTAADTTIRNVAPPPGVSSMSNSPPIASTNPQAIARPRPTPPRPRSSSRWNGKKMRPRVGGDTRAVVDDAELQVGRRRQGLDLDGPRRATTRSRSRRRWRRPARADQDPRARAAGPRGRRPSQSRHGAPGLPWRWRPPRPRLWLVGAGRRRLSGAGSCRAGCRRAGSAGRCRPRSLPGTPRSSRCRPTHVARTEARDRGLDRRERRA